MNNTHRKHFSVLPGILLIFLILLLTAFLFATRGKAKQTVPDEVPDEPTGLVVDIADVFTPDEEQMLTQVIRHFEKTTSGQLRVLVVQTTGSIPIDEYGFTIANRWKIGHKDRNDGVLFTLAIRDHANRIDVGIGWEDVLTNARCSEVLKSIVPELRAEKYAEASAKVVHSLEHYLTEPDER